MTDIVERLRGRRAWQVGTMPTEIMDEAAAEIERLRADNHKLMLWNEQLQAELDIERDEARRALEEKS